MKNRVKKFVIDGEAVVLGIDGVADFNALHSRRHDFEVQLYAFDCLALEDEDLRDLPLSMRKSNLARLLARRGLQIWARDLHGKLAVPYQRAAAIKIGRPQCTASRNSTSQGAGR